MTSSDEITAWIDGIRTGDSLAAQQLWMLYFDKLTRVAAQQLAGARTGARDEEDIALSAFKSFCMAARAGRFEKLVGRESLWPLLVSITAHKSVDAIRHENRKKRGGTGGGTGGVAEHSEPHAADEQQGGHRSIDSHPVRIDGEFDAAAFLDAGPSPDFAAELSEQVQLMLKRLDATGDPQLRSIAIAKMGGAGTGEIARELDCARRTIERKMQIIRRLLTETCNELPSSGKGR